MPPGENRYTQSRSKRRETPKDAVWRILSYGFGGRGAAPAVARALWFSEVLGSKVYEPARVHRAPILPAAILPADRKGVEVPVVAADVKRITNDER